MYPGVPTLDAIRLLASICLEYLHAHGLMSWIDDQAQTDIANLVNDQQEM